MSDSNIKIKPVYSQPYTLPCVFLLIPSNPAIQLQNGLEDLISLCLESICTERKLEKKFTIVGPHWLQWGIQAISVTQINPIVTLIRKKTSKVILQNYSNLRVKNLKDFWLNGYLAVSGVRPLSNNLIEHYIHLVRR